MSTRLWRPGQRQAILWAKVGGLAALQGAISLAWVIYNLYVPQLLAQFGFPLAWGTTLLVVENILAMAMEPLMGGLSDRLQEWVGARFPMIAVGVLVAGGLFLGIPAIALWGQLAGNPQSALRWVLLIIMVLWALAMTIFRSPALSLLGNYAFATKLPQAASWLSMSSALVGLAGGVAQSTILSWGPLAAFALGSAVLIGTAIALQQLNPEVRISLSATTTQLKRPVASLPQLSLIFGAGLGIALGSALLRSLLGNAANAPGVSLGIIFLAVHILTVLPAGALAVRWGNILAMQVGLGAIALAILIFPLTAGSLLAIGLTILCGAAFSLLANGMLPFALSLVPSTQAGLGTGMFFSGGALAGTLVGSATQYWGTIPSGGAACIGAIAFVLAGSCISFAPRSRVL